MMRTHESAGVHGIEPISSTAKPAKSGKVADLDLRTHVAVSDTYPTSCEARKANHFLQLNQ